MEPLKNLYNHAFFGELNLVLGKLLPGFDGEKFHAKIFDSEWEEKELKQRMKHIAITLHHFFPDDYDETIALIQQMIPEIRQSPLAGCRLEFMFLPEYVERYGIHSFDSSANAMEFITTFTSCEFAVRPFIIKYPEEMMARMLKWSVHQNHHVRRLASEGSRPRLPWAMALPAFKKNPEPVLPILENLKNDPSEYVRRSVANNLNDIAKDHPELVLEIGRKWKGQSAETDRIIKHGCRTLLKKAHPGALELFGYSPPEQIDVQDLKCQNKISIGEKLEFSLKLINRGNRPEKLRIEYGIDYMKANGIANRKIFKITENMYAPGSHTDFRRSQSFQNMTTRKHHPGTHRLAIIVNGREMAVREFLLV